MKINVVIKLTMIAKILAGEQFFILPTSSIPIYLFGVPFALSRRKK